MHSGLEESKTGGCHCSSVGNWSEAPHPLCGGSGGSGCTRAGRGQMQRGRPSSSSTSVRFLCRVTSCHRRSSLEHHQGCSYSLCRPRVWAHLTWVPCSTCHKPAVKGLRSHWSSAPSSKFIPTRAGPAPSAGCSQHEPPFRLSPRQLLRDLSRIAQPLTFPMFSWLEASQRSHPTSRSEDCPKAWLLGGNRGPPRHLSFLPVSAHS